MLKADNLVKQYHDFRLSCSLNVLPGRITGLVGRNGAGKSTIIKSFLGQVKPDSGHTFVLGCDSQLLSPAEKQNLGVVLTDSGFSSYLTITDICRILSASYNRFETDFFLNKCSQFHLPLKKRLKDFSTGMKAQLKLLISLSHQADILILDEPTAGLDVIARNDLLDLLRDYMTDDRAILISSHIASDLENLCDDLYLLHNGQILLHEETDTLLDHYAVLKLTETQYASLDREWIIKTIWESYGYCCLTSQKQFYLENYPQIVMEDAGIDNLILMLTKGGIK